MLVYPTYREDFCKQRGMVIHLSVFHFNPSQCRQYQHLLCQRKRNLWDQLGESSLSQWSGSSAGCQTHSELTNT